MSIIIREISFSKPYTTTNYQSMVALWKNILLLQKRWGWVWPAMTSRLVRINQKPQYKAHSIVYLYNLSCLLTCNITTYTITKCMWHHIHFTVPSWKWLIGTHFGADSYLFDLRWEAVRPASLSMLFSEMWLKVYAVQAIMDSQILESWRNTLLELRETDNHIWGLQHCKDYIKI